MSTTLLFSLFGEYQTFNTSNTENYLKIIQYFSEKKFKPSTMNELILDQNGNSTVNIMPLFVFEKNYIVEILSNRINFKLQTDDDISFANCCNRFRDIFLHIISNFSTHFEMRSNRIAFNFFTSQKLDKVSNQEELNLSKFFKDKQRQQMSQKNAVLVEIRGELCNVVLDRDLIYHTEETKFIYDINTVAENIEMRFVNDLDEFYKDFEKVCLNIIEGLN